MYRILIVKSERSNFASLYQFMTETVNSETAILEIETKEELDEKVESMLNDEGYAKSDFVIVNVIDYTIDAKDYSDDETESSDSDEEESDTDEESDEESEDETGSESDDTAEEDDENDDSDTTE